MGRRQWGGVVLGRVRRLRIQSPGATYPVTLRGGEPRRLFADEGDCGCFVDRRAEAVEARGGRWPLVYRGALVRNRKTVGKIIGFDGEGRLRPKKGRMAKTNDPSDWIVIEDAHELLVDAETFQRAQRVLDGHRTSGEDRAGVEKKLAAVGKHINATVGFPGNAELSGRAELEQAWVDLQRQRKELEARLAGCNAPASPAPSENEVRAWAKEKIEALSAAVDGWLRPVELRNVVSGYVDRIEVDPVAKTGTIYLSGDVLASLEANAIGRVNNGSG